MEINATLTEFGAGVVFTLFAVTLFNMAKSRGFSTAARWLVALLGFAPGFNLVALIVVFLIPKT